MTDPGTIRDVPETLDDEPESRLVGTTMRGTPMYYDASTRRLIPARDDGGGFVPDLEETRELSPDETLQDVIDEIGETIGWNSLVDDEN